MEKIISIDKFEREFDKDGEKMSEKQFVPYVAVNTSCVIDIKIFAHSNTKGNLCAWDWSSIGGKDIPFSFLKSLMSSEWRDGRLEVVEDIELDRWAHMRILVEWKEGEPGSGCWPGWDIQGKELVCYIQSIKTPLSRGPLWSYDLP